MAKKIKTIIKLQITAKEATPAPPVGPALGQHGLNIVDFTQRFNEQTQEMEGIIPVEITVYEDRTFDFRLKKPPVSYLLKKAVGLEKGAAQALREKVATINKEQIREIALEKMEDLNTQDVGQAEKIVSGTAKSMGIAVE